MRLYMVLIHVYQFQGYFETKVNPESDCKCLDFYHEADGDSLTERYSCLECIRSGIDSEKPKVLLGTFFECISKHR